MTFVSSRVTWDCALINIEPSMLHREKAPLGDRKVYGNPAVKCQGNPAVKCTETLLSSVKDTLLSSVKGTLLSSVKETLLSSVKETLLSRKPCCQGNPAVKCQGNPAVKCQGNPAAFTAKASFEHIMLTLILYCRWKLKKGIQHSPKYIVVQKCSTQFTLDR